MSENHYALATMLIRRPAAVVFEAFANPEVTTKFWFTHGSGRLEEGKQVEWKWEMYGVSAAVKVLKIVPNSMILIQWGDDPNQTVQWDFEEITPDKTYVKIINKGFSGDQESLISGIRDSTGGFHLVVAGLKAYLEHDIQLNLVRDKALGPHNE